MNSLTATRDHNGAAAAASGACGFGSGNAPMCSANRFFDSGPALCPEQGCCTTLLLHMCDEHLYIANIAKLQLCGSSYNLDEKIRVNHYSRTKQDYLRQTHFVCKQNLKSHFFQNVFIGPVSEPIRDLVDFPKHIHRTPFLDPRFCRFRGVGKIWVWKKLFFQRIKKAVFPQKFRGIVPTTFLHYSPLKSLYFFQLLFSSKFSSKYVW